LSRRPCAALLAGLLGAAIGLVGRPAVADEVHVVLQGETLWQIAAALSGDPHRWPELYRANRDQIRDPSMLYPGQRLAIPDFGGGRRLPAPGAVDAPPAPAPAGAD